MQLQRILPLNHGGAYELRMAVDAPYWTGHHITLLFTAAAARCSARHFDPEGAGHATVDAVTVLRSGKGTQESGIAVKTFVK
jgi:hypothetical protein